MTVFIVLTAVFAAYGVWITIRHIKLAGLRKRLEACEAELDRQRMLKQNLERICDKRGIELRRLRAANARQSAEMQELEEKASELNVSMFRESGLRILAEKEESARRMKLELLEKQLAEARRMLKEQEAQTRGAEEMYQAIIAERDQQIAKLQAAHARRAKARAKSEGIPDQISLDDLLTPMGSTPEGKK